MPEGTHDSRTRSLQIQLKRNINIRSCENRWTRHNVFEQRVETTVQLSANISRPFPVQLCEWLIKAIYSLVCKQAVARLFTLAYRQLTLSFYSNKLMSRCLSKIAHTLVFSRFQLIKQCLKKMYDLFLIITKKKRLTIEFHK